MAAYTMNTDKTFLRCMDMTAMEVYELDSPYTFPVKGRSWMHLGISIGPGKNYESLKIGDREINGGDLQTLIKDVFNSRLSVNREGLCFSATTGVTAVVLEVDYLRLFDLFDWSKYHVNTSLNTKWARSNFMDGRPLSILGANSSDNSDEDEYKKKLAEKEKELEKEKVKHKQELEQVKEETKKKFEIIIQDLKEAGRKEQEDKQVELDRLKEKLADAENKRQQELKKKDDEVEGIKKKNRDLEQELKIYVFKRSGLSSTSDFFKKMVQNMISTVPCSRIVLTAYNFTNSSWPVNDVEVLVPLTSVNVADLPTGTDGTTISYIQNYFRTTPTDIDLNNWRILQIAKIRSDQDYTIMETGLVIARKEDIPYQVFRNVIMYYDGHGNSRYTTQGARSNETIPIPCPVRDLPYYNIVPYYIMGIGTRAVMEYIFFPDELDSWVKGRLA